MLPTKLQQNPLQPKSPVKGLGKGGSPYRTSLLPKSPERGLGDISSSNHLPPKPFNSEAREARNKSSNPGVLLQQLMNRSVPTYSNQENLAAAHPLQTPQLIASPQKRHSVKSCHHSSPSPSTLDSCDIPQNPQQKSPSCPHPQRGD